jgi:hypothetical protein
MMIRRKGKFWVAAPFVSTTAYALLGFSPVIGCPITAQIISVTREHGLVTAKSQQSREKVESGST